MLKSIAVVVVGALLNAAHLPAQAQPNASVLVEPLRMMTPQGPVLRQYSVLLRDLLRGRGFNAYVPNADGTLPALPEKYYVVTRFVMKKGLESNPCTPGFPPQGDVTFAAVVRRLDGQTVELKDVTAAVKFESADIQCPQGNIRQAAFERVIGMALVPLLNQIDDVLVPPK